MTDEAMSPLRRRMIEDMTIRKLAPKTQEERSCGLEVESGVSDDFRTSQPPTRAIGVSSASKPKKGLRTFPNNDCGEMTEQHHGERKNCSRCFAVNRRGRTD